MKTIYKYISGQFGMPTGFGGRVSTFIMNCMNRKLYRAVINNLGICETDTVLEIGFGNGYLIRMLANRRLQKLYGIEISPDMLNIAARKNRKMIDREKIRLKLADVVDLPFGHSSFDRVYTVNTVYFWSDIGKGLSEIKRVLKPGGTFLNVIYLKEYLDRLPITRYGFTKFTVEQIIRATTESGLKTVSIVEIEPRKSICVVAKKENNII
jgi:ubiquinone/menaquinone biosynthesis C-methylase UbiE